MGHSTLTGLAFKHIHRQITLNIERKKIDLLRKKDVKILL